MKNVLICGATGFMGRNISEHFFRKDGYNVYGVGNSRTPETQDCFTGFFNCDLTSKEGINQVFSSGVKFDVVIQAAANTSGSKDIVSRPYLHVTDNAVMNALILQACYDYNVGHFLFLSCGVMYNPDRSPVTEDDFYIEEPLHKNYFGVGWTKIYVEKMCDFYSRLGKTKHTAIRHSNTYGPHDKYDLEKSHMFGATINKVMSARDGEEIVVWGDGKTERDLLYVQDVVDFIELAIEKQDDPYVLINVGYGKSFSVKEIVSKIIEASGKNLTMVHDLQKPSINTKLALVSKKAEKMFGWRPAVDLDEGIKRTIEWYKKEHE